MKIYPHYPKPSRKKASMLTRYFRNQYSWLDSLYERSYTMKMGEFKVPLVNFYIPNEASLIHRVLVAEVRLFPKHRLQQEMMFPLLGESIFTTNGKAWQKQRDLLNPSFEMVRISNVFNLMNNAAKDMLIRLENYDSNSYNNIDEEMTFTTADIIFRTILSKKLTQEEGKIIVDAFVLFQETSADIAMKKLFRIPKILQNNNVKEKYQQSGKTIRNVLSSIIQPRYDLMLEKNIGEEKDILSFLLNVLDDETKQSFSFTEILDQVAMLFLAGHETTASSMTWTLYLLALYQNEQEEAYQEIIKHCDNNEFTVENTKKLKFLTNIYKESLRLYPPVNFLVRETAESIEMRGKRLKKGVIVMVSPWLMHRNSHYWEDPHMFNPHRFDNSKNIHKNTYFPFGLGQRICIGSGFAMQESVLLLASILRTYKLELKPNFKPDIVGRLTTRSLNGMPIKFIKREKV